MDTIFSKVMGTLTVFTKFWHYELLTIGESTIKISNVAFALFLTFVALSYSRKISHSLNFFFENKLIKDKDAANIAQKISLYSIYFVFIIIILEVANIPLNIFAFIGGALAISTGLGTQNLVNNFISGLIILIEKPIKIGDIINIKDARGRVIIIGIRSTIIRNGQGVDILVPNSEIIQNNVFNWNYYANKIKYNISVNIKKTEAMPLDHQLISKQLLTAVESVKYLKLKTIKVNLESIGKEYDHFIITIELDADSFNELLKIKNEVNFSLIQNLKTAFTVEYPINLN